MGEEARTDGGREAMGWGEDIGYGEAMDMAGDEHLTD